MQVVLFQEGVRAPDETWVARIANMIDEASLADRVGFDVYAMSEQHFANGEAIVAAPEVLMSAIAAKTSQIRLRIASVNMLPYNHPIRVAEQIAMLDVISDGRAEVGVARSNNPHTLAGFGVDPKETKLFRNEHLNILSQAFTTGSVDYESDFYGISNRRIAPWPDNGRRQPPFHLSASGIETHRFAGQKGLGVMSGLTILGWEYAEDCLNAYKNAVKDADPFMGSAVVNRAALLSFGVCCHKDRQVARELIRPSTERFLDIILEFFLKLADSSPDYEYFSQLNEIVDRKHDMDFLCNETPYVSFGTPEDIIADARKVYDLGYDDLIWRIEGMGHEENSRTIEMLGKEVLPEIHSWPEHPNSTPASTWTPASEGTA